MANEIYHISLVMGELIMELIKRYKIYALLFFSYVVIYFFLMQYALNVEDKSIWGG